LYGQRTEVYQALRCPTCGEGVFILPRSPLTDPPAPPEKKRPRTVEVAELIDEGPIALADPPPMEEPPPEEEKAIDNGALEPAEAEARARAPKRPMAEVEIEFEEDLEAEARRRAARAKATAAAGAAQGVAAAPQSKKKRPVTVRSSEPARPMVEVAPERTFGEWVHGNRHPLIFLAVLLLVVGTVVYRLRQKRHQELPQIALLGKEKGLPALDAGEFDTAQRLLGEAARAVRELGGDYEDGEAILQGAAEASIFVDLIPRPLEELINEAARAQTDKEWQERFTTLYKGRSVILDGHAAQYRILARSGLNSNRMGRVDTTGIELLESAKAKKGEASLVVGARLESIHLEAGEWVVRLDPKSVVVMKHWDALKAFGWPVESDETAGEGEP
jgi:hypothetical protein